VLKSVWYGAVKCVLQGLCVEKCVVRCGEVCCRVYVLKSVWYGVVKCVLQGSCVEKCVVRCGEVCVAGFIC